MKATVKTRDELEKLEGYEYDCYGWLGNSAKIMISRRMLTYCGKEINIEKTENPFFDYRDTAELGCWWKKEWFEEIKEDEK